MEFVLNPVSLSRWNSFYCISKKPYLSYRIRIETTKSNVPKLSNKQITLYQKICELRFDENLTWEQVANRLNKLGYTSTRGNKIHPQQFIQLILKLENILKDKIYIIYLK